MHEWIVIPGMPVFPDVCTHECLYICIDAFYIPRIEFCDCEHLWNTWASEANVDENDNDNVGGDDDADDSNDDDNDNDNDDDDSGDYNDDEEDEDEENDGDGYDGGNERAKPTLLMIDSEWEMRNQFT